MRQEFGWQGRAARRVADWSPPPPDPKPRGPWEHLPKVAFAAALLGIAAGAGLTATDRERHDRLMIGAGLTGR